MGPDVSEREEREGEHDYQGKGDAEGPSPGATCAAAVASLGGGRPPAGQSLVWAILVEGVGDGLVSLVDSETAVAVCSGAWLLHLLSLL